MTELIQQVVVVIAIVGAAAYLAVHFLRRRKYQAGCRSCPAMKDFARKLPRGD